MKLACLVLAYRGAAVLAATAPVYHAAGWDIYVHLDAKGDMARYRADLGQSAALCRFIEPRELVFWGGYSMIRAQLRLIEATLAGDYDKFLLISDDTLPLFPPSHLNDILGAEGDFVSAMPEGRGSRNQLIYRQFYYYDHQATTMKGPRTEQGTQIDETFEAAIADIAALRRRGKKDITLAYGSQFWALERESLQLILDTVASDEHLVKSFQYARLPDELMFQSILLQAKYKPGGIHTGPVMADFHSQDGGPRILHSIEGLPFDLESYQVFARKAAPSARHMLSAVSERLLRGQTAWGCAPADFLRGAPVIDEAGGERPVVTMRLAAPEATAPRSPSWHAVETYRQQKYRWTGQPEISWTLDLPRLPAGKIRFFLPLFMSKPGFVQQARLRFGAETKPLHLTRQSLLAEFEHQGCEAEPTVTLITPEPVPASPPRDTRLLGLAIGL
jgi:hypothetical protein